MLNHILKTMYIVNLIRKILDMLILLKTTKQQRNFTFLDSLDLQAHCAFPGLGTACQMICVNPQYPRIPYKHRICYKWDVYSYIYCG